MFHYEPVWTRLRLSYEHDEILDALEWISTDMWTAIAMCDRFMLVYRDARTEVEAKIMAQIGISANTTDADDPGSSA